MRSTDPTLATLATRTSGAASLLAAIDMGLIEMTPETIGAVIATLRDTADTLESMQAGRYAGASESEGGSHD
jgi:hypothetical protein